MNANHYKLDLPYDNEPRRSVDVAGGGDGPQAAGSDGHAPAAATGGDGGGNALQPASCDDRDGAPPEALLDCLAPGTFCADLWASVSGPGGTLSAIMEHHFLMQLADGSLDEQSFKFYVVQGALYLREFARALAVVASKAPRPEWVAFFGRCAQETYLEEDTFHKDMLAHFGTTVAAETSRTALAPYCQLYTGFVLSTVHERAFGEALAAVLPCFVVYLAVGRALLARGSPHALYQKFIDRFGGGEYEQLTLRVVAIADEVAAEGGQAQRQRMRAIFQHGCRLEWLFWEAALQRQAWPV